MLGLFARKDPVCGMKEEKGKGIVSSSNWFCSAACKDKHAKQSKSGCCCGH
ncbi:hypothetical protein HY639_03430 [Candidatus Woesearchaeota archaeon]|nr:hypothetical protein [Candidatus Woesearchaeota archaeon]